MLTIQSLSSSAQVVDYYQDYYVKDDELQGEWFGKSAKLLNLEGKIELKDFVNVLEGKLSPGISMPTTTNKRRPGYDLTFSAPKSVSILALIGNNQEIFNVHVESVNDALNYLEQHFAATRVKLNNEVHVEKTRNILVAKFNHVESRALDPKLHTHAVLINATLRNDEKWRTIFLDEVYDNSMLLGVIYRGELAKRLMQLGFEITQISEQGLFELKNFPQELIQLFSKRRAQIKQELAKQGLNSTKAAQIANLTTRNRKVKADVVELKAAWQEELQTNGFSLDFINSYIKQAKERGPVIPPNPYYTAKELITKTAKDLSDWKGAFTTFELIKHAAWLDVSHNSALLEKVLGELFKTGELLYLGNNLCTTQVARDLEILNILNMKHGKHKNFPMFSKIAANYLGNKISDTQEIQTNLKVLLINTDNQIVLSANNQSNFLALIKPLVNVAYDFRFYPIGLTQTVKRKSSFIQELGLKRVQTIEGFLKSCANRAEKIKQQLNSSYTPSKQIWILDLHSSISSSQLNALQNYAKQFGTRIIWANKITKPQVCISSLLKNGIKECSLEHVKSIGNSALMNHPVLNTSIDFNNSFDLTNWQTNLANTLINWVIAKHQQHQAVFSLNKVKLELFSLGLTVPTNVLQNELNKSLEHTLVTLKYDLVTTKDNIDLEKTCLQLVTFNQNTVKPIATQVNLPQSLTKGQQDAINLILTTSDRIIGIQGIAGAGKTTMLRSLNKLCSEFNFEIIGITTTTSAKERLQIGSQNLTSHNQLLKSGIKTLTVRKFLIESAQLLNSEQTLAKLEYGTNKLIVLNEGSFVSTSEMVALINKVEQLNSRLVVIGDHKQLSSVEAGNIFYLMLGSKMKSVAMTQNVRFKSKQTLEVMKHIYQNQIENALQKLNHSLIEIPDHQQRITKITELYLAKSIEEREHTILITPEHADRKLVNHSIRQGLKKINELNGIEINCHNLTQVKLTKAESQKIFYFKPQDFIVFYKTPVGLQVKTHEYYRITDKDLDNKILTLEHVVTYEKINWLIEKQISTVNVYRQERRLLMQSDRIRWLQNNQQLGICNGQTAKVKAVDVNYHATLTLKNNQEITLNLQEFCNQHWDYAYAATTFVAQGADEKFTIALTKGGYSKEVLTKSIKPGDVLVFKEENNLTKPNINSKLVKVLEIKTNYIAKVEDRDGHNFELNLKKSPNNQYCKNQAIWDSYPNPLNRKSSNIPKLTSVNEFLVSVTRGDEVTLLVDHIESYQHALEQKLAQGNSALEFISPTKEQCKAKVEAMTRNITGVMVNNHVQDLAKTASTVKNSLYQKSAIVTIEQIINKLHSNILLHTTNWLGQPQKTTKLDARWGKKGSLVVKYSV